MTIKTKKHISDSFITYLTVPGCIEATILLTLLFLFLAVIYSITLDGNLLSWISAIGGLLAAIVSLITLIFAIVQVKKWHQHKVDDFRLEKVLEVYICLDTLPNLYKNYRKVKKNAEEQERKHTEGEGNTSRLLERVLVTLNNRVINSEKHITSSLDSMQLSFDKYIASTKFISKSNSCHIADKFLMTTFYTLLIDSFIDEVDAMFHDLESEEAYINMKNWIENQRTTLEKRTRF